VFVFQNKQQKASKFKPNSGEHRRFEMWRRPASMAMQFQDLGCLRTASPTVVSDFQNEQQKCAEQQLKLWPWWKTTSIMASVASVMMTTVE